MVAVAGMRPSLESHGSACSPACRRCGEIEGRVRMRASAQSIAASTAEDADGGRGLSPALTVACAATCGAMVANLYYAQPLIGLIAPELGLGGNVSGLIVTLTQLGYGAGLLLI